MYQPSYSRKLEAVKIDLDRVTNSGDLSDCGWDGDLANDPFVIDDEPTDKIERVETATDSWKIEQLKRQNLTATLLEVDEEEDRISQATTKVEKDSQAEDKIERVEAVADSWKAQQLKRQNLTATLLEVDEDENQKDRVSQAAFDTSISQQAELERQQRLDSLLNSSKGNRSATTAVFSIKTNREKLREFKYKSVSINNYRQLKHLECLLSPEIKQRYFNRNIAIKLKGIVVFAKNQKVGLILADISQNNRVAEVISLVTPKYLEQKIENKLIHCLEQCLPKINCDRLIFKI